VPLDPANVPAEDLYFSGFTLIRADNSPKGYDPRKMVFFASAAQAVQQCATLTHYPTTSCPTAADCFACTPTMRSYVGQFALE
jgi:hypothetical protein